MAEPQRETSKQPKLYDTMPGATKLQLNRRELDQAAAAQRAGEAIAYTELENKYSQPVVKFRSEITRERAEAEGAEAEGVASSGCKYECDLCLKSFDTAIGLRNHMQWHEKPLEEGIDKLIRRSFAGTVSARMLVADGGAVRLYLRWLANQFFTIGRWWAGAWDRSWSATQMGAHSRRLTVSE